MRVIVTHVNKENRLPRLENKVHNIERIGTITLVGDVSTQRRASRTAEIIKVSCEIDLSAHVQ